MVEGEKTYTTGGNMRAPSLHILCDFVIKSWDAVAVKTVMKSFKKCGISNSWNGKEEDMLWNDSDKETGVKSPADKANGSDVTHVTIYF